MFCPKCGKQVPDGAKFCGACGEKLTAPAALPAVVPAQPGTGKSVNLIKLLPLLGIAAVVLLVTALGGRLFSGGRGQVAYLADGVYHLVPDLNKGDSLALSSAKADYSSDKLLRFTSDGKYVYFFTKYDSFYETGTLCRAETSKIRKDMGKNEKHIQIIGTNVRTDLDLLENGMVLYRNYERDLYCYDGEQSHMIARNVREYYTDEAGRMIYIAESQENGRDIYALELKDANSQTKLDGNISEIWDCTDLGHILYTKYLEDGTLALYTAGFGKDLEKLAENVQQAGSGSGKFYFTTPAEQSVSLYDYVLDETAAADAMITEPNRDDYAIPKYSYDMVYGSNLKEEDFDELYTSFVHELYWYGESTWWCYSMEDAINMDWGDNSEGLINATEIFITKFGNTADENGYIKVTAEVKAALQEIQKYADHPENEWQWLWLCYNKHQTGTTTDTERYEAAREQWKAANNRNNVREALKNPENNRPVYTLHCFEKGQVTTVHENVFGGYSVFGGYMFNAADMYTEKVPLEEVESTAQMYRHFDLEETGRNYILCYDTGKVARMTEETAQAFADLDDAIDVDLMLLGDYLYLGVYRDHISTFSAAKFEGDTITGFSIVSDDAYWYGSQDDAIYLLSGFYDSNGYSLCDLYVCRKDEATCIARDILSYDIQVYSDGYVAAWTASDKTIGSKDLTLFDSKGNATTVGKDVSRFVRVDDTTVIYLSEGNLYRFNGKERKILAIDISRFWVSRQAEIALTIED